MSMHFSINRYKYKRFYQYKHSNLNYRAYGDDCSNNEECDFKKQKLYQECDNNEKENDVIVS